MKEGSAFAATLPREGAKHNMSGNEPNRMRPYPNAQIGQQSREQGPKKRESEDHHQVSTVSCITLMPPFSRCDNQCSVSTSEMIFCRPSKLVASKSIHSRFFLLKAMRYTPTKVMAHPKRKRRL